MNLPVRGGAVAIVDDDAATYVMYDKTHELASHEWYQLSIGHVVTTETFGPDPDDIVVVPLSSLLMQPPPGSIVTYRNGNTLDNRRENLEVTKYPHYRRRKPNPDGKSGRLGVLCAPKLSPSRPWRAQIGYQNHNYHLGMFPTREEAVAVRRAAEMCLFGETCE